MSAAVLPHHQKRKLLDRARERFRSRFSLGCSGKGSTGEKIARRYEELG